MRINPVIRKELKAGNRSIKLALTVMLFNAVLAAVAVVNLLTSVGNYQKIGTYAFSAMLGMYALLAAVEFFMILMIVPAITSSALSGERERQTLELLLVTDMSPFDIILGKLVSLLSTIILLVISSFPVLSLGFIYSGLEALGLVQLLLYLVVLAVFVGSISIFFSALFMRTAMATVASYLTIFFLTAGTLALVWASSMLRGWQPQPFVFISLGEESYGAGMIKYLLLLNPGVGFYDFFNRQMGDSMAVYHFCRYFGSTSYNFVIKYWSVFSILIQLICSAVFLWLAQWVLNPMHRKKKIQ